MKELSFKDKYANSQGNELRQMSPEKRLLLKNNSVKQYENVLKSTVPENKLL